MPRFKRLSLSIAGTTYAALASVSLAIGPASAASVSQGTTTELEEGLVADANQICKPCIDDRTAWVCPKDCLATPVCPIPGQAPNPNINPLFYFGKEPNYSNVACPKK